LETIKLLTVRMRR